MGELGSSLPLKDIRVLDLTRLIPGAVCTGMLGDLGAEVIKIENIEGGDYERQIPPFIGKLAARFLVLNRNKKSIALNLKKEKGREIFLKMVRRADVLVEGFRPGVMKRLRLDYPTLKMLVPGLVYCSISSFGQDGPYRDVIAHDINILGETGFFDVTGRKGEIPPIPGIQIADSIAGIYGALGILVALRQREKSGKGQNVDVSMFDGLLSWMFDPAKNLFANEKLPLKGEGRLTGGLPNYNLYKTKDGKLLAVGAIETKFWNMLLKKLGREDLIVKEEEKTTSFISGDSKRLRNLMEEIFLLKTRDEWMNELGNLNICVTPVRTLEEAISHPQAVFRKMVVDVRHPVAGHHRQIGFPIKFSDTSPDVARLPAPRHGEHTISILKELEYADSEIKTLMREKIIFGIAN